MILGLMRCLTGGNGTKLSMWVNMSIYTRRRCIVFQIHISRIVIIMLTGLLCGLILITATACSTDALKPDTEKSDNSGKNDSQDDGNKEHKNEVPDQYFPKADDEKVPEKIKKLCYKIENRDIGIQNMETDPNGELYFLTFGMTEKTFIQSVIDGKEKGELCEGAEYLYYDKDLECFYIYNMPAHNIEVWSKELKYERTLYENLEAYDIKEMAAYGESLFILTRSKSPYTMDDDGMPNEDGYLSYGETLHVLSTKTGELTKLQLTGLITMCDPGNGYLYMYSYKDGGYYIDVFNPDGKTVVYSVKTEGVGYITAMAVVGKKMYYFLTNSDNNLRSYDMETGKTNIELSGWSLYEQQDLDIHGTTIVFLKRTEKEVCAFDTVTGSISSSDGSVVKTNDESDVVIGVTDIYNLSFGLSELSKRSGLAIGTYGCPENGDQIEFIDQLMVKLMAGDSDVDIYILPITSPFTRKLANDGVTYPLDESEVIREENEKLFDNIGSQLKTPSGKIWGIPLKSDIKVFVTYPENMKKAGLKPEIFKDYFTMLEAFKKTSPEDRENISIWGIDYGTLLIESYITNNRSVDFESELFRKFFDSMWSGWKMWGAERENSPYLGGAKSSNYIENERDLDRVLDTDNTSILMCSAKDVLKYDKLNNGTEIYPMPLLSENYSQAVRLSHVAVVNPYGRHRENAVKLLEVLAVEMRENGNLGVSYKDPADYLSVSYKDLKDPKGIDIDSKAFKAIYEIANNAVICDYGMINDYIVNEIYNYQYGKIDFETAIKSMQRKEDTYRNE